MFQSKPACVSCGVGKGPLVYWSKAVLIFIGIQMLKLTIRGRYVKTPSRYLERLRTKQEAQRTMTRFDE